MFFPEGQVRVFLYGQPVSMRLSFDGLYALARHSMQEDPLSGHLFAFINRRADQSSVLRSERIMRLVQAPGTGSADRQLGARHDLPEVAGLGLDEYEVISEKISYRLAQRPGSYVILK